MAGVLSCRVHGLFAIGIWSRCNRQEKFTCNLHIVSHDHVKLEA